MANIVFPDLGKETTLAALIAATGGGPFYNGLAHLYTNNHTPAHGDTLSSYTEAAWTGYAAQTLTGWSSITLDGAFRAQVQPLAQQFANNDTSAHNVYGVYFTDSTGANLLAAALFDFGPLSVPALGFILLTDIFTTQSEF